MRLATSVQRWARGLFPAIAGFLTATGLGLLSEAEGLLFSRLLPPFAVLALAANVLGWMRHRQWHRCVHGKIARPSRSLPRPDS